MSHDAPETFYERLHIFTAQLDEARRHLDVLGLADRLDAVDEALSRETFRISVLGRFKSGKSSVINALLDRDISPTATLPCTSTVIEFEHAAEDAFFTRVGANAPWQPRTRADFEALADLTTEEGTSARRWRVELPVPWLGDHFTLVDTPGTNEDVERLRIANEELARADAALVVLRADQAGAIEEMEMAEDLQARVGQVLLLVNRMDLIPEDEHDMVLDYVRDLAEALDIPPERILPMSARLASEGDPRGVAMLDTVRAAISDVLATDLAGARLLNLMRRTEHLMRELEAPMRAVIEQAQEQAARAATRQHHALDELSRYETLHHDIRDVYRRHGMLAGHDAASVFAEGWPDVLYFLQRRSPRWDSARDPLRQPKAFVEDLIEAARVDLNDLVTDFSGRRLRPIIEERVQQAQHDVAPKIRGLLALAAEAGLGEVEVLEAEILEQAMQEAFGEFMDETTREIGLSAGVTAAVSGIVGYAIAKIMLFYLVGLIGGLLNPVMLAATIVVGGATYLFMGRDAVKDLLREKIAEKLKADLSKRDSVRRMQEAIRQSVSEQFDKLAEEYARQVEALIERAREIHASARDESERRAQHHDALVTTRQQAEAALVQLTALLRDDIAHMEAQRGSQ